MRTKRRVAFLDVPYEERMTASGLGAKYDSTRKSWYAEPDARGFAELVRRYGSVDFSLQRWLEDDENGMPAPPQRASTVFTPKPHQKAAAEAMLDSWKRGYQGFLIADGTGIGKTLSTLYGAVLVAKAMGCTPVRRMNLLIVCPKAVIPSWRQTIRSFPAALVLRPLIINYQSLNKLIKAPAAAKKAKTIRTRNRRTARSGSPRMRFRFVIFDEEQYLKNYGSSAMSLAAATLAELDTAYAKGKSPFVVSSTATPGTNPLEFAIMAPWLSRLVDPDQTRYVAPSAWATFLSGHGFDIRGKTGKWRWAGGDRDVRAMAEALARPHAPYIIRNPSDIAGWPTQQLVPMPMDIGGVGMAEYMLAWARFRERLALARKGDDKRSQLVEALRFRQKSSILKAKGVAEFAVENVRAGRQVFVGCEFVDTMDIIEAELSRARVPFSEYSGRNETDRERGRLDFQTGRTKVVLCTSVEGVSFHAGETLPDGTKATVADRVTIIADVRNRVLNTKQQMGRCHRDGQNSICYVPYAEGTIDEKVISTFARRIRNMDIMLSNDSGSDYLDAIIDSLSKDGSKD